MTSVLARVVHGCDIQIMYTRVSGIIAVLGIASFAFWKVSRRKTPNTRSVQIDDDAAAEIIRRLLPALDRVYRLKVA